MLSERQAWRRPLAVVLALAVAASLCWLAWAKFGDHAGAGKTRQAGAPAPRAIEAPTAAAPERQRDPAVRGRLEAALRRGVAAAAALGGRAEAAAMLGDWERPLVATAGPDGPRQVRMWSLS
ncbi:MAG TPA: hypothetical protein VFM51_02385, partial [Solirubrobacterales bacterium]|nr:hypothetical protein [Solirubrobacterales bacterium]